MGADEEVFYPRPSALSAAIFGAKEDLAAPTGLSVTNEEGQQKSSAKGQEDKDIREGDGAEK